MWKSYQSFSFEYINILFYLCMKITFFLLFFHYDEIVAFVALDTNADHKTDGYSSAPVLYQKCLCSRWALFELI